MTGQAPAPPGARVALIGDVHGNAAALGAVLAAVRAAGISDGVVTGDIAMRGPEPAEAVARVRALGWPVVCGNTDVKVGAGRPRPTGHPASDRTGSRSWTIRRLSDDDREWLAGLPPRHETHVAGYRVLVTHGQPGDLPVVVDTGTPDAELARLGDALGVDVLVVGHTHRPMVRRAGRLLVVNPGAVGEGADDDRRPSWAWLEVTPEGGLQAHLARVAEPLAPPRAP
ncbi:MAG TPA: metallophosphoesterase family protein [Miltoncostaeaceae bacterium]|nr:metallophosphoesterase family protein [Miltoncostaeaceae bacterium]